VLLQNGYSSKLKWSRRQKLVGRLIRKGDTIKKKKREVRKKGKKSDNGLTMRYVPTLLQTSNVPRIMCQPRPLPYRWLE